MEKRWDINIVNAEMPIINSRNVSLLFIMEDFVDPAQEDNILVHINIL